MTDQALVHRSSRGTPLAMPGPNEGPTVVRVYKGSIETASADAAEHAPLMAQAGYREVSRVYTPGSWGCGAFLVALVLAFLLIGILIFIYLIVVKPAGSLVVTYTKDTPAIA